jgi:hypothetical protein
VGPTLELTKVTKGVIIVENPQNGKILAMVSLPSYNDQLFADGISETDFQALLSNPDQPLLNKAIGAPVRARIDVQARDRHGRAVAGPAGLPLYPTYCRATSRRHVDSLLSQPYIQIGDTSTGSGTSQGGARWTSTGASPTRATPSSTSWPSWSASTG